VGELDGFKNRHVIEDGEELDVMSCGREEDVRVEVCDDCALALGNWDVFIASAFDDSERDGFGRH
jgi:hypothetical protein